MFNEAYKNLYNNINPDRDLIDRTLQKAGEAEKNSGIHKSYKKVILAAAVFCLCLIIAAVPVLAIQIEPVYELLYAVSPSAAQFFTPVMESSTCDGIEMKVVACYIHENTAEVYITLRDTKGERIDETVDLYDYSIHTPFDAFSTYQLVDFDEEAKTATLLVSMSQWDDRDIEGDKITFSVRKILTNKKIYNGVNIPFEAVSVQENCKTANWYVNGASCENEKDAPRDYEDFLLPGEPMECFKIDGVNLTSFGYAHGRLHLQTAVKDYLNNDNHGYFYFVHKETGERVNCTYSIAHNDEENNVCYDDSIFDIPKEELGDYLLFCRFVTCGKSLEGRWSVTFPIENKPREETVAASQPETEAAAAADTNQAVPLEALDPVTKQDYYHKILNSVDYYNTVSGKITTNMLNNTEFTIDYSVNMNNGEAYQRILGEGFDEEVYVSEGLSIQLDNINKTIEYSKALPKAREACDYSDDKGRITTRSGSGGEPVNTFKYRQNPTNLHYASTVSIFPQELSFGLLSDFDLWNIQGTADYLGRECVIITGKIKGDYLVYDNTDTFMMLADRESGIILQFESYDSAGNIAEYQRTEEISFEETPVKSYNADEYPDYAP